MDDILIRLIDTLKNYDEYVIEEAYSKLKYDNFQYNDYIELVNAVVQLIVAESDRYMEKEIDYAQYTMREQMLSQYEKVDARDVYQYIFPEDSLQICDELDSKNGIGNLIRMDIVEQWSTDENGCKHYSQKGIQSIITDDLRFLFVYPQKLENSNIILSNVNLNSYFGNRRLRTKIDKIFGLIIEVDGVIKESQINYIINEIEQEHIPVPNFLINSGHGLHFYYVLDEPIYFHNKSYSIYPVITNILNALKDLIWTPFVSDLKPETMDLNRGYAIIGTRNRKNPNLVVTAYKINPFRCSLEYLRMFIDKPCDDLDYDISFPPRNKVTKEETVKLYPHWAVQKFPTLFTDEEREKLLEEIEKKKQTSKKRKCVEANGVSFCNPKVYDWFLNLISDSNNIRHGNRYKCMVALAIYGVKCGIAKEQVQYNLKNLLPMFNSVKKNSEDIHFLMNETDIKNALTVYKKKDSYRYTFDWIMDFTGISYEKKTKRRKQPLSQEEHLKLARQNRDELYPDGSWRGYSDGATKKNILKFMIENPKADINECINSGICSRTSIYKYWDECRLELGLEQKKRISNEEKVKTYQKDNPNATKADCIRDLKLSKPTVYKYWSNE